MVANWTEVCQGLTEKLNVQTGGKASSQGEQLDSASVLSTTLDSLEPALAQVRFMLGFMVCVGVGSASFLGNLIFNITFLSPCTKLRPKGATAEGII